MITRKYGPFTQAILYLTLSDIFTWGIYTVLSAMVGLYLATKFAQNAIAMVGTGVFIYMITRALLEIPAGRVLDKVNGLVDETLMLFSGSVLMALPFLLLPLITAPQHYYVLQALFGAGVALNLVSWRKLFASSLTDHQEGRQYAVYDTTLSLFMAFAGLVAGNLANISAQFFDIVIVCLGVLMLLGSSWALLLLKIHKRKKK